MKKIMFILVVLALTAFPTIAYAGDGIQNNPNHFELDMNCDGEYVHVTIPTISSSGGRTEYGVIGHPRTHYIDFGDGNGFQLVGSWGGRGNQTVWCTWTWDRDPFVHGMDIQFSPAK